MRCYVASGRRLNLKVVPRLNDRSEDVPGFVDIARRDRGSRMLLGVRARFRLAGSGVEEQRHGSLEGELWNADEAKVDLGARPSTQLEEESAQVGVRAGRRA